jgi:ribosomal protein L11 methyltransferase
MKKNITNTIDWQEQWELFAEKFDNGYAHIDLNRYGSGQTLLLMPGAGFGDLSHPTTRLTLEMMAPYVKGKVVVDIGCGSGILSIAAVMLGAVRAYGVDIDDFALKHASDNAHLNNLETKVKFFKPSEFPSITESVVVVMNMISSEQQSAWKVAQNLNATFVITSGILKEQQDEYLSLTSSWRLKLLKEKEEEEWKVYLFNMEKQ